MPISQRQRARLDVPVDRRPADADDVRNLGRVHACREEALSRLQPGRQSVRLSLACANVPACAAYFSTQTPWILSWNFSALSKRYGRRSVRESLKSFSRT